MLCGGKELARGVVTASGGNAFELRCNIGQLIALTRRARILVGGDTGPLHLAAALEIPVVGLYGPTDPGRTGVWSQRNCAAASGKRDHVFLIIVKQKPDC